MNKNNLEATMKSSQPERVTIDVDPNAIAIDLPVNDRHVQELMVSMNSFGQAEDIVLRASDLRVVNGFHRTVAAQRLGWPTIRATVCDYDDETFWSARIIAAKPHQEIEPARLSAWMFECWKQTKWYVPLQLSEKSLLPRAYSNTSLNLSMVEMVWSAFFKKRAKWAGEPLFKGLIPTDDPNALTQDEQEVVAWVRERGRQWGKDGNEIVNDLMREWGFHGFDFNARDCETYDSWARKYNLGVKERVRMQQEILRTPGKYSNPPMEIAERYVAEVIAQGKEEPYSTYADREEKLYWAEVNQAKLDEEKRREEEIQRNTPPEILAHRAEREATANAKRRINSMRYWIAEIEESLSASNEGLAMVDELIAEIVAVRARLWPKASTPKGVARITGEIAKLTAENQDLRLKVKALEGRRQPKPQHRVLSSTEIEAMPH